MYPFSRFPQEWMYYLIFLKEYHVPPAPSNGVRDLLFIIWRWNEVTQFQNVVCAPKVRGEKFLRWGGCM